jgi:hypothetical protein
MISPIAFIISPRIAIARPAASGPRPCRPRPSFSQDDEEQSGERPQPHPRHHPAHAVHHRRYPLDRVCAASARRKKLPLGDDMLTGLEAFDDLHQLAGRTRARASPRAR